MLGFGAAFTDAACYMFNQLPAPARDELFHELFIRRKWDSMFAALASGPATTPPRCSAMTKVIPILKMKKVFDRARSGVCTADAAAGAQGESRLVLFCPESSRMDESGRIDARRDYPATLFRSLRQYFRSSQAYAAAGVPVQAVTVQNEVDTDQDGRMPACLFPQEYEIGFLKYLLGPLFQQNGISTKIWILDHNYNLWGRAICELDDDGLRKYCNAIAFHGYVGTPEMMDKVHDAHPDAQLYWTEGGPDYTAPDYATDWANWGKTFTQAIRHWCQSLTGWNLALDEKGRPNIGPFSCGGMVTIHSQTKEITRSGQYWAFAHFSRNVRRGAKRFDSACQIPGVEQVAFENPDGQKVLVVTNSGPARTATLKLGSKAADVSLPADSVTTLTWS